MDLQETELISAEIYFGNELGGWLPLMGQCEFNLSDQLSRSFCSKMWVFEFLNVSS
jgi:hypothetical protein